MWKFHFTVCSRHTTMERKISGYPKCPGFLHARGKGEADPFTPPSCVPPRVPFTDLPQQYVPQQPLFIHQLLNLLHLTRACAFQEQFTFLWDRLLLLVHNIFKFGLGCTKNGYSLVIVIYHSAVNLRDACPIHQLCFYICFSVTYKNVGWCRTLFWSAWIFHKHPSFWQQFSSAERFVRSSCTEIIKNRFHWLCSVTQRFTEVQGQCTYSKSNVHFWHWLPADKPYNVVVCLVWFTSTVSCRRR